MTKTHNEPTNVRAKGPLGLLVVALATASLAACGGASNSEVTGGAGTGSTGAAGTGSTGAAGTGSTGAAGTGTTGAAGTGVTGAAGTGATGAAGTGTANCPAQTTFTLAVHIIMDATWAGTAATNKGEGKIHLWNRAKLNANGTALMGDTWSCGSILPDFTLNFAGMVVTGGSKVNVEVPNSVWDQPTIPKFPNMGMISGWNPGNTIKIMPTIALVGLTMPDPMAAWPMSYTGVMPVDADGDTFAGFTAVPKQGTGYVTPPTALGVFGSAPSADKVYLATRTVVGLNGKLDTCTEQSGTTAVMYFDSHVVGCHVKGGGECTPAQIDFIDTSRTDYKVTTGTFKSKQVPDTATCAEVRAALPM